MPLLRRKKIQCIQPNTLYTPWPGFQWNLPYDRERSMMFFS